VSRVLVSSCWMVYLIGMPSLEHSPPIPTLQPGNSCHPLHKFLGFSPSQHILSMSARDPHDCREMPPNGNAHICVFSLRGVRKVKLHLFIICDNSSTGQITSGDWSTYTQQCKPDMVFALSDTPFTDPPYSQKRLTKSIERSAAWLANLLQQPVSSSTPSITSTVDAKSNVHVDNDYRPNILLHLAGSTSIQARRAFSDNLIETLQGKEADAISPLRCLDDGVHG
jgi:hypothetical protein